MLSIIPRIIPITNNANRTSFYSILSINTMAPHQYGRWETAVIVHSLVENQVRPYEVHSLVERPLTRVKGSYTPKSILRRANAPAHWPLAFPSSSSSNELSAHFPPADSIVTDIHTRPRTHILEVPDLHYSDLEIKMFKREYKRENKMESIDCQMKEHDFCLNSQHDYSFWVTVREWYGSLSSSALTIYDGGKNAANSWDPLNDNGHDMVRIDDDSDESSDDEITESTPSSSLPSSIAIITSVSQMAQETLSRSNRHSPHSTTQCGAESKNEELSAPSHWIHCTSFNM